MYKFILIFLLLPHWVRAQKLNKEIRGSIIPIIQDMLIRDQKYRLMYMYGTMDSAEIVRIRDMNSDKFDKRLNDVERNRTGIPARLKDSLRVLQKLNDSINQNFLIEIIHNYGYVTEKQLGKFHLVEYPSGTCPGHPILSLILLHQDSEKDFKNLLPILKEELDAQRLPPTDFAAWYDRCMIQMNRRILYGEYGSNCVDDFETSNKERKKIGLNPLSKNNCK